MTAPRWPHGARAACAFTFDLDAETLWLARGVTEPVALSQGTFGPAEALPRILELLHQAEIPASFFVPAWVAEHHPDAVKAIVAAGHEVGCHGDVHERVSDLDAAPFFLFTGQRAIQPPGPVLQAWLTELDGITEVGGVTTFTFHPQIIGRPSRFACLRELIEHARRTPKLWLARLDAIAGHARAALA